MKTTIEILTQVSGFVLTTGLVFTMSRYMGIYTSRLCCSDLILLHQSWSSNFARRLSAARCSTTDSRRRSNGNSSKGTSGLRPKNSA